MATNISITVDDDNLNYLNFQVSNRSRYINQLIENDRAAKFAEKMRQGYLAQSQDPEIKAEDRLWDETLGDGIEEN